MKPSDKLQLEIDLLFSENTLKRIQSGAYDFLYKNTKFDKARKQGVIANWEKKIADIKAELEKL